MPEDSDSDDSEDEEIQEESGFISVIDTINPYVTFKKSFKGNARAIVT